jgi:hypothetical protein
VAPVTGTHLASTTAPRPSESINALTARQNDETMTSAAPRTKRRLPWQWGSSSDSAQDVPKLPPREAFLCKTFLEALDEKDGDHAIGSDLDRLAEICARSRYSLSNRYEVHVAPHGSGNSFLASATVVPAGGRRRGKRHHRHHSQGDLTLQAVTSDDDSSSTRSYRRRRERGKSMAHTTLETIMQSSRSSEEEKRKKKSASEIKEEVRGRAARHASDQSITGESGSGQASGGRPPSTNAAETSDPHDVSDEGKPRHSRKKSASFASVVMDNTWQAAAQGDGSSPRHSAAALISQPALPQASTSHLEIRTAPDLAYDQIFEEENGGPASPYGSHHSDEEPPLTGSSSYVADADEQMGGVLSGLRGWMPWQSDGVQESGRERPSQAVGSLRQLLQSSEQHEGKGKGVAFEV